jgi:hypothetical protein
MSAVDYTLWELLAGLFAVVSTWSGIILWAVRSVVGTRLDAIQASIAKEGEQWKRVDESLTQLRIELPEKYLRREDWIRFSQVIDAQLQGLKDSGTATQAKLDALRMQIELWEKTRATGTR